MTTTRVTHASPANIYAHVADRNWESDNDLTEEAVNLGCTDIASQFPENAGFLKVSLEANKIIIVFLQQICFTMWPRWHEL